MKRTIIKIILTFALTAFAVHATAQTAISTEGMIESKSGGFKFPDGSVQLSALGACAETCPITASCVDSECKCPGAQVLCDGSCIDVLSDELNCGSCGHTCAGEDSCNNGFCPLETIASSQGQPYGLALGPNHVYWSTDTNTNDKVLRAGLDGQSMIELAGNQNAPREIFAEGDVVYWANFGVSEAPDAPGQIQSYDFGGTGLNTLVDDQLQGVTGLAVFGGYVYWTNLLAGTANDASTINPIGPFVSASGLGTPQDILVDYAYMYVTEFSSGQVRRQPLGGGSMQVLAQAQGGPFGLALNGTHVYFANAKGGQVRRVPISGGVIEDIATGQQTPSYVAIDGTHVYWTNYGDGTVARAPLDGGVVSLLAVGQNQPFQIAVNGTHVYWTNLGGGTIMRTAK